jgi:AcrR family transcriptional regulator
MTTINRAIPRPGGRSARVQAAVHEATIELLALHGRAAITVPLIAARAGVTPSTIYRRWGELADLLADVAVERLRPDGDPVDTGSVAGDLLAWVEQYRDEMSSDVGLGMMLDVLSTQRGSLAEGSIPVPCQCVAFTAAQIEVIVARGVERGEPVPEVDAVMDAVVSPIVYRSLFGPPAMSAAHAKALVVGCLKTARKVKDVSWESKARSSRR